MLYRQEYLNTTGRKRGDEVLAYHVRQAFKPGKITAEKANRNDIADIIHNIDEAGGLPDKIFLDKIRSTTTSYSALQAWTAGRNTGM